jgi:diguanylate cyclase (GGDEF)-like protein
VPQQSGLGRGLAALLPGVTGARAAAPESLGTARTPGPEEAADAASPDAAHGAAEQQGASDAPATRDDGATPVGGLSAQLAEGLANTESGLGLIYRTLNALVDQYGLVDAAIVIEEPGLGRQVFRAGRRPLDLEDETLLTASAGLYTEPPLDSEGLDRSLVVSLCVLALRLDLLRYDAWHDPLTGLYDRRSFDRLLEMAVARSNRYGWPFTLVFLDLDSLKAINDQQGHPAGDAALRELAERFRRVVRAGDSAARIGGDEFAMILPGTEPDLVPSLLERVRNAPGFDDRCPSFSFGVAQCPKEADDFDSVVRLADERLYQAKDGRSA